MIQWAISRCDFIKVASISIWLLELINILTIIMMNRWFAIYIILVLWTYVPDGICLFLKRLEVITASVLLKDWRRDTAFLRQVKTRIMIFKVILLSHIYYLTGYGMNKRHRRLFLDIIKIVIRIACSWKCFAIDYSMLRNRLIFWIKLIYILGIDVVNWVTFWMSIPLINLGEHLIQYWHYLLI